MNKNYEPCFYNVSNDWQERWSLIREFTTRWHGIQFCDRTELLPLVKQEENKLGFELPPSFQEYILFFAEINQQERWGIMRDIYQIKHHHNLSTIEILRLGEDDAFWGIKEKNILQLDPPIESYSINYEDNDKDIEKFKYSYREASHLTSFVLDRMKYYLHGNGGGYFVGINVTTEFLNRMDNCFDRKSVFENMYIYETQNIIAIVSLNDDESRLLVELWKPLPKNKIPKILFDYINNGGCFSGIFADSLDSPKHQHKNANSDDDWTEIPF